MNFEDRLIDGTEYTYIVQKCLYYIRILQRMRVRRLNNVVKNYLYISQKID